MKEKLSREKAARILDPDTWRSEYELYDTRNDREDELWNKAVNTARKMGAEALLPWVRTADRKPVAKEVGSHVFGLHRDGFVYPMNTTSISQRHFPYWMPIPPLPEADHE